MTETQPFENLKEVPRKFSPVPIWWWSGDEVTEERLKFQMEQMVEGGIYNAMIMNVAPNAPLFGKDMDNPNYMSDRWWELFEFTCQTAKELGIYIWFYDQIGFSGANFQARVAKLDPAYQGQKLSTSSLIVDGVQRLSPPEDATLLAAYARSIDAAEQPLGEYELLEIEDGKAVTPSGRYQVMLVFSLREGFNYFSREACDLLLDKVHGEFDRHSSQWFGDVIVGSFQDELPALSVWGDTFAESFKAMKGYDLIPLLVDLFEGASKRAKRTRRDYQDVRAKLAEEAFFKPFYQWHEDRGLVCGIDQSGLARGGHTIDAVYYYADYIRTQRWYAIPGSDLMGNAKIHASIADQYNRHRVWIESFHSSGWGGTLEETFDWLLPWYRDGANLYDPHAFYYSTKGGFWEWAPPSTCWRQPYWKHYKQFADATTRMSYMLTGGTHVSDIAVLYPTSSAQSLYKLGMSGGFGAINELDENATEAHKLQSVYEEITGNLNFYGARKNGILAENQRDYEIINESTLAEEAQIRDGAVTFNNSRFHTVILPNLTVLTEPAARALVEFVHQGGNLIAVASLPENVDPDAQETFDQLHALFNDGKGTFIDTGDALKPLLDQLPNRVLEAPVATLHRKKGQQNILFVPATKIEATEDYHGGMMAPDQTTYNFSADHYLRDLKLTIHDRVDVYQMNLITGDVAPAVFNQLNSSTEVRLSFEDAPAVILLWEDGSSGKVEPQSNTPLELVATLPDQWRYTMIDTMQNRYGDFTKPNFEGAPAPATWFFRHHADADGTFDGIHADPSDWQTVQATFGQQAWSLTAPLAQLPGPAQTMDAYALIESVENWSPVVYSKTRGIAKDQLHSITLGPSGHIPEEFMSFGEVPAGSGVQVRTAIWSDMPKSVHLAVGGNSKKQLWLNGIALNSPQDTYLSMVPVELNAGMNVLDLQWIAEEDVQLRAYWSLVEDTEDFRRPEWLKTSDNPKPHEQFRFTYRFDLDELPVSADISYAGTKSIFTFRVNGQVYDIRGGFAPYEYGGAENGVAHPDNWKIGENLIEFDVVMKANATSSAHILMDAVLTFVDDRTLNLVSGDGWTLTDEHNVTTDAFSTPYRRTWTNPAHLFIRKRPTTLPGFEWLEEEQSRSVTLDAVNDAFFGQQRNEWFSWKVPSAASRMTLDVAGKARLWIDGVETDIQGNWVLLPETDQVWYDAVLRVEPDHGRTGGAVFNGPVTYEEQGEGCLDLGDWQEKGLESYSGGIRYETEITVTPETHDRLFLDLGKVRGTAEVSVNGNLVGARFLSPYRFDLSEALVEGKNTIAVTVFNTLAPYLNAAGATRFVPKVQLVSGLFGPVRLLRKA